MPRPTALGGSGAPRREEPLELDVERCEHRFRCPRGLLSSPGSPREFSNCLLYTSDAADDM
eukprot:13624578-Alexandrium_andersonii.AAC.1